MRYIDTKDLMSKSSKWGNPADKWKDKKLKKDFREYFYGKCWYSEKNILGSYADVDHFRPKDSVQQFEKYNFNKPLEQKGYSWLRNDVDNYRYSCKIVNSGLYTEGKKDYFPLTDDSPYLTENGQEDEKSLLLDPCVKEDVELLTFFMGNIECSSDNNCDKIRVKVTSKVYNLTHPDLERARISSWTTTEKHIKNYLSGDISVNALKGYLLDCVNRTTECSAVAISCVKYYQAKIPQTVLSVLNLDL